MSSSSLLRLEKASFGFGERVVLNRVSLDIQPGEFTGIMGPNGSGKSTLLRGMLGLIAARDGRVECRAVQLGYVPQRENLDTVFPLSGTEVVEMGAYNRLSRFGRVERADRTLARESLERVGLGDRALEQYSALSGGQRQRVLIARALVARPRLLLLDEPTSGIDSEAQRLVMDLLHELSREEGVAILFVTHNAKPLEGIVQQVLWVADQGVKRIPLAELPALSRVS